MAKRRGDEHLLPNDSGSISGERVTAKDTLVHNVLLSKATTTGTHWGQTMDTKN